MSDKDTSTNCGTMKNLVVNRLNVNIVHGSSMLGKLDVSDLSLHQTQGISAMMYSKGEISLPR